MEEDFRELVGKVCVSQIPQHSFQVFPEVNYQDHMHTLEIVSFALIIYSIDFNLLIY